MPYQYTEDTCKKFDEALRFLINEGKDLHVSKYPKGKSSIIRRLSDQHSEYVRPVGRHHQGYIVTFDAKQFFEQGGFTNARKEYIQQKQRESTVDTKNRFQLVYTGLKIIGILYFAFDLLLTISQGKGLLLIVSEIVLPK